MARPMSGLPIVYVVDGSVAPTGALVALRHAAQALKDDIRMILVLPEGSTIPANQLTDFMRVEYIPMVSLSRKMNSLVRYLPAFVRGVLKLKKLMQADGATILWLNDFYLMHGAAMRLLGYPCRVISFVRCFPRAFAGPLALPMLKFMRVSAHRVVAVSNIIAQTVSSQVGGRGESGIAVIYDYFAGAARMPTQISQKRFVYIGNYIEGKGQDVAIDAFAIAAEQDASMTLAFYGGDMGLAKNRAYRQSLVKRVEEKGFTGRVTFHDFVTDTKDILASAYAALNFSRAESFSMTVLEASGAGLPVIATQSGGPAEILVEGKTGYLVPIQDPNGAAEAMIRLASDPVRARMMGEAGAAHVAATFSKERYRQQMLEVLGLSA